MRILKKTGISIFTIFLVITISFLMVRFMPGNPLEHLVGEERYFELMTEAPAELEAIAERYGLNDSLWQQYVSYLKSIFTLDFGIAYSNNRPVLENVLTRAGWTLMLSVPTFLLAGLLGGVLGMLAGWRPGGLFDRISTPIVLVLNNIPMNCIGIVFLVTFAFKLGWFPVNGMSTGGLTGMAYVMDILWHAALPLMLLVLLRTSGNFLMMKSYVSQVRNEEYVTTAFSKGLSSRRVLTRHVLKNAMLPFTTSLCIQLGNLLSGSMLLEVIFGWNGMGNLFYTAVSTQDFPTAQLCFMISAVCTVLGNLLADILIARIDPRIREAALEY